jgi:hypothetical protein
VRSQIAIIKASYPPVKDDEEYNLYRVRIGGGEISATGRTLELALIKAIQQAGIEGVELAPTLEAAEVLESLLGANR